MLSRIADSLFWLNRYMERADGILRVTRTNYIMDLDSGITQPDNWKSVLALFTQLDEISINQKQKNKDEVLRYLLLDTTNLNSLKVILTKARENARGIQDHITKEVWENVNQLYHNINQYLLNNNLTNEQVLKAIEELTHQCVLYTGVTDITMPRGIGWSFMNLGKYIERCFLTIQITDIFFKPLNYAVNENYNVIQWKIILLSLSGYELYLKNYRTQTHTKNLLHELLLNKIFPHSVIYSLERINKYLNDILQDNNNSENEKLARTFGRLKSKIEYIEFESLDELNLQLFLTELKSGLLEFSSNLAINFFSYS